MNIMHLNQKKSEHQKYVLTMKIGFICELKHLHPFCEFFSPPSKYKVRPGLAHCFPRTGTCLEYLEFLLKCPEVGFQVLEMSHK